MRRVLIPPKPGHFSAYGMLFADFRYDLVETVARPLEMLDMAETRRQFETLEAEGARRLSTIGVPVQELRYIRYAEMRYQRQEYTIKVRLPPDCHSQDEMRHLFEDSYSRRYGHASREMGIDVVMLRVVVDGRTARPREKPLAVGRKKAAKPTRRPIWFAETGMAPCDVWQRDMLREGQKIKGPAVIEEDASTTVLCPGDVAQIDPWGNIAITLGAPK
jgi:N-methylhydantoinase A